jgi:uncharacterized membrane protein YsdA (DUF1294 family)
MSWLYSWRFHLALALSLCAVSTIVLWWVMTTHQMIWWQWLAHWLLCVNLVTFAYYGADNWLAQRMWPRIPEIVLQTLGAVGGSPAALLAMRVFRHKTIKGSFRILFWSIALVQVSLAVFVIVKLLQ